MRLARCCLAASARRPLARLSSSSSASAAAAPPLRFAVGDEVVANWQADLADGGAGRSLWHNGIVEGAERTRARARTRSATRTA